MSAELTPTITLNYNKGSVQINRTLSVSLDVSATALQYGVQNIGTSDETLALGEVGTPARVLLHNLDATNYVTFGADSTNQPVKVGPGGVAWLEWNGAAVHAKANTGACDVEYWIFPS